VRKGAGGLRRESKKKYRIGSLAGCEGRGIIEWKKRAETERGAAERARRSRAFPQKTSS